MVNVTTSIFNGADQDLVDAIFAYIFVEFPELAARVTTIKAAIRKDFSGDRAYIPRRSQADRDRTVSEVLTLFNGRNATEIARRLGVGRTTVYRIIKTEGGRK
jgi:Mor family transcriptional regulator